MIMFAAMSALVENQGAVGVIGTARFPDHTRRRRPKAGDRVIRENERDIETDGEIKKEFQVSIQVPSCWL